jgi:disulfide bond formation protein DsbB
MTEYASFITLLLSLGTVAGDIIIVVLIGAFIFRDSVWSKVLLGTVAAYAIELTFFTAFVATLSSLVYSEAIGFIPCSLCWIQRIFMYGQILLLGMAIWKNDKSIVDYSIGFSVAGAAVAVYHSFLQFGGSPLLPCAASVGGSSCSQRYFLEFGYVTIPTMALTAFGMMIIFMLVKKFQTIR